MRPHEDDVLTEGAVDGAVEGDEVSEEHRERLGRRDGYIYRP